MVNTEKFIERLEKILKFYGLSASAFADKVKVQRSSISHLLTGRNKPSLDFVLKVVATFQEVNLYWLLLGQNTFPTVIEKSPSTPITPKIKKKISSPVSDSKPIDKIVIFYTDNSFESFTPK
ncbi:MAG: transcriptional regulator [Flavobacteriaceae bacterium]|nr:MAG: transcriptional regulator [Flavobacteriaceae bacterium]